MKVMKSKDVTGNGDDESLLMKVSEREFALLYTLIGCTTGGFDALTMPMYKEMRDAKGGFIYGLVAGDNIKLNNSGDIAAKMEALQHAHN